MKKRLKIGLSVMALWSTTLMATSLAENTLLPDETGERPAVIESEIEKLLIGDEEDAVATKSYVDLKISELNNFGNTQVNEQLQEKLNEQEVLINKLIEHVMNHDNIQTGFEIVTLQSGECIYGNQGTEMIVRSGEGIVIAADGGGIQDVTDGLDLPNEVTIPNNNLLIIPRNDGRGICAKRTTVIMVRGGYNIE